MYKMYEEEFANLPDDIWQIWAKIHVWGKKTLKKKQNMTPWRSGFFHVYSFLHLIQFLNVRAVDKLD